MKQLTSKSAPAAVPQRKTESNLTTPAPRLIERPARHARYTLNSHAVQTFDYHDEMQALQAEELALLAQLVKITERRCALLAIGRRYVNSYQNSKQERREKNKMTTTNHTPETAPSAAEPQCAKEAITQEELRTRSRHDRHICRVARFASAASYRVRRRRWAVRARRSDCPDRLRSDTRRYSGTCVAR